MITKIISLVAFLFILSLPLHAQQITKNDFFKPYGKSFIVSSSVYWSGAIADMVSSRNKQEANGFFRNKTGTVDYKKAVIVTGSTYILTLLFEKKHPKAMFVIRTIVGGVRFGAAVHNSRIKT